MNDHFINLKGAEMSHNRAWDTEGKANRLYGRKWRKARLAFLGDQPFCCMCAATGEQTLANVVDHITPHKGDESLFWDQSNWQPLCARHHNSEKARIEIRGYSDRIGIDGWPLDPAHPSNCGVEPISGRSRPVGLKRINVPVFIVVGAPASGKSTWCRKHASSGDTVIDFDDIAERITGIRRKRNRLLVPLFRERNKMLLDASAMTAGQVFMPMGLANAREWDWWRDALGPTVQIVMVRTALEVCLERIPREPERLCVRDELEAGVRAWWKRQDPAGADIVVDGGASEDEIELRGQRRPQKGRYLVSRDLDEDPGFA